MPLCGSSALYFGPPDVSTCSATRCGICSTRGCGAVVVVWVPLSAPESKSQAGFYTDLPLDEFMDLLAQTGSVAVDYPLDELDDELQVQS